MRWSNRFRMPSLWLRYCKIRYVNWRRQFWVGRSYIYIIRSSVYCRWKKKAVCTSTSYRGGWEEGHVMFWSLFQSRPVQSIGNSKSMHPDFEQFETSKMLSKQNHGKDHRAGLERTRRNENIPTRKACYTPGWLHTHWTNLGSTHRPYNSRKSWLVVRDPSLYK